MKKIRLILVVSVMITIIFSFTTLTSASSSEPLKEVSDITNLLNEQNLDLENWQVIVKEKVDAKSVDEVKKQIEKSYPNHSFQTKQMEEATKYILSTQKKDKINESFILVVPFEKDYAVEVIYTISGDLWNEKINKRYSRKLEEMTNTIFTQNLTKFSCVQTSPSGNISSVYLLNNLQKNLNVQTLDNIKEDDFTVLSGTTPLWESAIPTSDGAMNVQMAAREGLGGKTTITIGTPIITTEY
ncbi:YwmB family TATA-box binding protein [Aquibacillus kalidii]|uniref:YwmB family TATA-box binding protein n=1 Tax=Aquibacillus kalidii TaxID=2762597 RepID=UPI00164473E6|nr:YwmB family TATA-box binding protein [Aquibacillus kalidii]